MPFARIFIYTFVAIYTLDHSSAETKNVPKGETIKKIFSLASPESLRLFPNFTTFIFGLPQVELGAKRTEKEKYLAESLISATNLPQEAIKQEKLKSFIKQSFDWNQNLETVFSKFQTPLKEIKKKHAALMPRVLDIRNWWITSVVFEPCVNRLLTTTIESCKQELKIILKIVGPTEDETEIRPPHFKASNYGYNGEFTIDAIPTNGISTDDFSILLVYEIEKSLGEVAKALLKSRGEIIKFAPEIDKRSLTVFDAKHAKNLKIQVSELVNKFANFGNLKFLEVFMGLTSHTLDDPWFFYAFHIKDGKLCPTTVARSGNADFEMLQPRGQSRHPQPNPKLKQAFYMKHYPFIDGDSLEDIIEVSTTLDDPFQTPDRSRACAECHTSTRVRYRKNLLFAENKAEEIYTGKYIKQNKIHNELILKANQAFYKGLDNRYFEKFLDRYPWSLKWKNLIVQDKMRSITDYDFHMSSYFAHRLSLSQRAMNFALLASVLYSSQID